MFRRFLLSLAVLSLAAWCAITVACGGSSNKGTSCTGGPFNVVGNWQTSVQSGSSSVTGYGAIDSNGLALFFDNSPLTSGSGDTLEMPTISGSCSFSGNMTSYQEPGGLFSGQSSTATAQGNVTSATAISGTFTSTNGSGTFSAAPFSPLNGSVSAVTGSKIGQVEGAINSQPVLLDLTFTATGTGDSMSFTSTNNNTCSVTGTFTQVGTANVFDVSMTFTSTGGGGCALTGTFSGLGFEGNSDYFDFNGNNPADTYLYADILASGNTFVMEIF
jgi:hypothetical protein